MTFCFNCFKKIESLREPCPYCGAPPLKKSQDPEEVRRDMLHVKEQPEENEDMKDYIVNTEVHRLMKRGNDCYAKGKAWLATKNKANARKDFERAVKYFNSVLKLDPTNKKAREYKTKSMQKIS